MDMQRMDILKDSGIINQEIYDFVIKVAGTLNSLEIETNSGSPAEVFLTHLAMAAARQINNDPPIEKLDAAIFSEVEANPQFGRAKEIWDILAHLSPTPFCEAEVGYFHLHICTMLQQDRKAIKGGTDCS